MSRRDATLIQFGQDDYELARVFHALRPTVRYGNRAFPSVEQYRQAAADAEQAGHRRARVLATAQRDWHARGQNGCLFARLAALAADGLRWDYLVAEAVRPERLGELVSECAAAEGTEVLSVLVPDLTTAEEVLRFVRGLVASSSLWLERDEVVDGYRVCHLRCPVPGTSADVQAWVMGFGPFDWMPNTRRGPSFELAIRVREKASRLFHRLNQDRSRTASPLRSARWRFPSGETRRESSGLVTTVLILGLPDRRRSPGLSVPSGRHRLPPVRRRLQTPAVRRRFLARGTCAQMQPRTSATRFRAGRCGCPRRP